MGHLNSRPDYKKCLLLVVEYSHGKNVRKSKCLLGRLEKDSARDWLGCRGSHRPPIHNRSELVGWVGFSAVSLLGISANTDSYRGEAVRRVEVVFWRS